MIYINPNKFISNSKNIHALLINVPIKYNIEVIGFLEVTTNNPKKIVKKLNIYKIKDEILILFFFWWKQ